MTKISIALILFLTLPGVTASATPWQVGIAKTDITPSGPIWLAGYAARNHPAEGTLHPLWAKALVIQDAEGGKAAILTTDLIGLPGTISEAVAKRIETETGIPRDRLLMNFSHTHSGPVIDSLTDPCYGLTGDLKAAVVEYTRALQDKLVAVVLEATKKMQPANLAFGRGKGCVCHQPRAAARRRLRHRAEPRRTSRPRRAGAPRHRPGRPPDGRALRLCVPQHDALGLRDQRRLRRIRPGRRGEDAPRCDGVVHDRLRRRPEPGTPR